MRIAYFVSQYPRLDEPAGYFWGGTGEVAAGLAEAMSERGHEVTVVTSSPNKHPSVRQQNGVRVIECPSSFRLSQAMIAPSILWAALRDRFDIVHAHAGNPPAPFGALVYHLIRDTPLFVTYHGDPQDSYGTKARRTGVRAYEGLPLRFLLREADLLFVPSITFREESRVLKALGRNVEELPNGFPKRFETGLTTKGEAREELGLPVAGEIILFFGSLNPYKGPDVLLRAASLLRNRCPQATFVFAGDGLLKDPLERAAAEMGLRARTRFEGFVSSRDKATYYSAADVFVLPSTMSTEVFPIAILEAFAAGLPVVVSGLRTFERFVSHNQNGLVVRTGDAEDLAEAIERLVMNQELRSRLAKGAAEAKDRFDWSSIASLAEQKYLEALGDGNLSVSRR